MTDFCAMVDFKCLHDNCDETVKFNVMGLKKSSGVVACSSCFHQYQFDNKFIDKLERFRNLLLAVQDAKDILGGANVGVMTPAGEVKVPYYLLMTRMNTLLTLDVDGKAVDFCFRVEPIDGSFR